MGLALLLAVGRLGYHNTLELVEARRWIAHTHDVLDTVESAVAAVKDNEIAVRGFLVTSDEELARRRELARPLLTEQLDRLRTLTADNASQRANVDAFEVAVIAKLAYADDLLERRRTQEFGASELGSRLAESLRRTDEIKGLAAQIQHEERGLLAIREDAAGAKTSRALTTLVGGTLLGVTLLAIVLGVLHREVAEHRATEARLRTSENRLTLALDASQMGLWDLDLVTDESHRTLRHDQIFGYDSLQPFWGREIFRPHLHPADREVEQRAFETALATGDFQLECRIFRHGDRDLRWISSQGKLFRDARGEPIRMMGSVIDVTERKEAEERLRERSLQLEAANEALGSFTYSVSHDLRAPLRAINGYAHILVEDHADALDAESRRVLDVICDNARQMGQLIDDLLRFSRLGRDELERAWTDVVALTRAVVDDLRRAEPERQVEIAVGDLPMALADGTMLRHALTNLIGNAWKFTRGRPDARIAIDATESDGRGRLLGPRQRRGLRHAVRRQALRRLPTPAPRRRVRGHRRRSRHRPARDAAPWRADLGRRRRRPRGDVPFRIAETKGRRA